MPFILPAFEKVRDDLLRDIANQLPEADTGPDSDYRIRANSVASAIEGLYQHQAWMVRQIFPDSADSDYLEQHARIRGLSRKVAVAAQGQVQAKGNPGVILPAGLLAKVGEHSYISTSATTLDTNGQALVNVQAQVPGSASNLTPPATAQWQAAPAGVLSEAPVIALQGGVEQESDGELLARLLELIRRPPAGGNQYDYRRWALEVPGVSAAYVYPLRRGLGTVDVVVTAEDELPSAATLAAVQQHIDQQRPVTAHSFLALAPTPKLVDLRIALKLEGLTLAAAQQQIEQQIQHYFRQLPPGAAAIKSRLEALVSDLPGVIDRALLAPSANITAQVDETQVEWLRPGTLTLELLT